MGVDSSNIAARGCEDVENLDCWTKSDDRSELSVHGGISDDPPLQTV